MKFLVTDTMSEPELDGSYQIVDDGEGLAQPMEEDSDAEEGNPGDDQQQEEQQDDSIHCFTGHSGAKIISKLAPCLQPRKRH